MNPTTPTTTRRLLPEPKPRPKAAIVRTPYRSPVVRVLGSAADLLEVLGPAQANYGGPI